MSRERYQGWMFIDALCINQEDLTERGNQVVLMGDIYRGAEEVVAWLGDFTKWDTSEMDLSQLDVINQRVKTLQSFDRLHPHQQRILETFLDAFLNSSYWLRLWIVQELLLARRIRFRAGCLVQDDAEFFRHTSEIRTLITKGVPMIDHLMLPYVVSLCKARKPNTKLRLSFRGHSDAPQKYRSQLVSMVLHQMRLDKRAEFGSIRPLTWAETLPFSIQDCSEPRDSIFGLLGLTCSRLQVDYTVPILDLYLAVLTECILEEIMADQTRSMTRKTVLNVQNLWLGLALDPSQSSIHAATKIVWNIFFEQRGWPLQPAFVREYSSCKDGLFRRNRIEYWTVGLWKSWFVKLQDAQMLSNRDFPSPDNPKQRFTYEELRIKVFSHIEAARNSLGLSEEQMESLVPGSSLRIDTQPGVGS